MRDMPHAAAHGGGGGEDRHNAATTGEIMRAFAGGLSRPTEIDVELRASEARNKLEVEGT